MSRPAWIALALMLAFAIDLTCAQQLPASQPATDLQQRAIAALDRGADFLLAEQSRAGGWGPDDMPGMSAIALKALIQTPVVGPRHPAVVRGLKRILERRHADGGIYGGNAYKNYESAIVLSTFAALQQASPDAAREYTGVVQGLQDFLKSNQWDESEHQQESDPFYGGAGYGRGRRPDLSNTQFMLEALHDSGLSQDDPAYKKALLFVQRCQMRGESNDQAFAKGATEGGFIYTTDNGGESKAGSEDIAGRRFLRSYGTMTYAGFKSLIYCGLKRDDPRVQAAWEWIRAHWTLDANPNMPDRQSQEGVYYYYHVFARALLAAHEPVVTDKLGREHEWRTELINKVVGLQHANGSWVNRTGRFMEGEAALATSYAMLALQGALEK